MMCRGCSAASQLISGNTPGPPISGFSSPVIASMLSRISSAARRRGGKYASSESAGSIASSLSRSGCSPDCLIGGRLHDQSVQLLDRPVVLDEPGRQPIEQLGVRGPGAHRTEVVRRRHDAFAEMLLPDAVDDDAGRERVARAGDPFGERQPAAVHCIGDRVPGGRLLDIVGADHRAQQAGLDRVERRLQRTAGQDVDGRNNAAALRRHGVNRLDRQVAVVRAVVQRERIRLESLQFALQVHAILLVDLLQALLGLGQDRTHCRNCRPAGAFRAAGLRAF